VSRLRRIAIPVALVLLTSLVYAALPEHGFLLYDDQEYVVENPIVNEGVTARGVARAFGESHSHNWHPLTWISHMLDVSLFGLERPGAHHVVSLLLHLANTLLVYALFVSMTGARGRSGFVAAVFALHPLHVESVAWISERKDLLSAFFGLLSMQVWVYWTRGGSPRAYWGAVVLFAAAVMSKPMLVTLPFVLLLLDVWPLERWRGWGDLRALCREKLALFALSALSCVVTVAAQSGSISSSIPLGRRLANASLGYAGYLRRALWPMDLAVIYPYPLEVSVLSALAAAALVLALTAAAFAALRRWPYVTVGWLWFAGMLVPVIGLVQVGYQPLADRYTYLPLTGLGIVAAWGGVALVGTRARIPLAAFAVLLALLWGGVSRAQLGYWSGDVALFGRALSLSEENFVAHHGIGMALERTGNPVSAAKRYRRALEIQPGYVPARRSLGNLALQRRRPNEAAQMLEVVVRDAPHLDGVHVEYGLALEALDRHADAVASYRRELERDPGHHDAMKRLAVLLSVEESVRDTRESLRLARILVEQNRGASELDVLAASYAALERWDDATRTADEALEAARSEGDERLARHIRGRASRYRAKSSFVDRGLQ
jgi:tetratricopeptide (TPR) repeat protein